MEKPSSKVRVHRSKREWDEIVKDFRSSGIGRTDFCRERSLSKAMFLRALARHALETREGFARLGVPDHSASVQVDLPGSIRVSIRGIDPVILIQRLVNVHK